MNKNKTYLISSLYSLILFSLFLSACGASPSGTSNSPADSNAVLTQRALEPCTSFQIAPTPAPQGDAIIKADDHILGSADAASTYIVYTDFTCDTCATLAAWLKKLIEENPGEVRLVVRINPMLDVNEKSALSAQAAEAAALQGKFFEMYTYLFARKSEWKDLSVEQFSQWLLNAAAVLGLDSARFQQDLTSDLIFQKIVSLYKANRTRLPVPPLLILNDRIQSPPYFYDNIKQSINLISLGKKQYRTCPPYTINPLKQYIATLHTAKGDVVIQLFADKAPNTVNNFIFLANQGWYDNNSFYRVIPGFIVQTGDPSDTGLGGPGYYIHDEIAGSLNFERAGMVAMYNTASETNGSMFFITLAPAPQFNGLYTIFGQVISGVEALSALEARDPQPGIPLVAGDLLLDITIEEK